MQNPPPAPQTTVGAPIPQQAPSATEMYEAATLARRELRNQVADLSHQRQELQGQLQQAKDGADKQGIESRLATLDKQLVEVNKQLAAADALVAQRAGVPGVVVNPPSYNSDIPPGVMVISGLGMLRVVMLPFAIAMARRVWKTTMPSQLPRNLNDLPDRINNIERGLEAVAIEVERLGEGQRFVTQLLADGEKRRQQRLMADSGHDGREL